MSRGKSEKWYRPEYNKYSNWAWISAISSAVIILLSMVSLGFIYGFNNKVTELPITAQNIYTSIIIIFEGVMFLSFGIMVTLGIVDTHEKKLWDNINKEMLEKWTTELKGS
jgi:hypothetical protein